MNRTAFMLLIFSIIPFYVLIKSHLSGWGHPLDLIRGKQGSLDRLVIFVLFVAYVILINFPLFINPDIAEALDQRHHYAGLQFMLSVFPSLGFCFVMFRHVLDATISEIGGGLVLHSHDYKTIFLVSGWLLFSLAFASLIVYP